MNYHDYPGCATPAERIRTHLCAWGLGILALTTTATIIFAMMFMASHF